MKDSTISRCSSLCAELDIASSSGAISTAGAGGQGFSVSVAVSAGLDGIIGLSQGVAPHGSQPIFAPWHQIRQRKGSPDLFLLYCPHQPVCLRPVFHRCASAFL